MIESGFRAFFLELYFFTDKIFIDVATSMLCRLHHLNIHLQTYLIADNNAARFCSCAPL